MTSVYTCLYKSVYQPIAIVDWATFLSPTLRWHRFRSSSSPFSTVCARRMSDSCASSIFAFLPFTPANWVSSCFCCPTFPSAFTRRVDPTSVGTAFYSILMPQLAWRQLIHRLIRRNSLFTEHSQIHNSHWPIAEGTRNSMWSSGIPEPFSPSLHSPGRLSLLAAVTRRLHQLRHFDNSILFSLFSSFRDHHELQHENTRLFSNLEERKHLDNIRTCIKFHQSSPRVRWRITAGRDAALIVA